MDEVELVVAETKVGPLSNVKAALLPSFKLSTRLNVVTVTLPVFLIPILYVIISPASVKLFALTSLTVADFITFIEASAEVSTTVKSL